MKSIAKTKRWGRAFAFAPLSIALLAACGGAGGGNADTPEQVAAHSADSSVVLSWKFKEENISFWHIYCNGESVGKSITNYYVVKGLENNKSYDFQVTSVFQGKESAKSTAVSCAPLAGATYNVESAERLTPLEEMLSEDQMKTYIDSSLVTTGNNYRVKRFLEKIKRGEEATVGYFGGSITVGRNCTLKNEGGIDCGYAYNSFDYLRNYYAKDASKLHYVNAAISGTATETGIVRIQEDLLAHNPDLVFIEFAGNNSNSKVDRETFEACVRKILNQPNSPAVIVVFCATYYTGGGVSEYINACATTYDLPVVSVDKALKSICRLTDQGMLSKDIDPIFRAFIDDDVHPNNQGHRLFAKAVDHLIDEIDKEKADDDPAYALNMGTKPYDTFHNINLRDDVIDQGGWEVKDTKTPAIDQSMVTAFNHGYVHTKGSNEPFELNVYAKNFIIEYRCYNPALKYQGNLVIDYKKVGESKSNTIVWSVTKNFREKVSDGWDNPVPILLFDETAAATYTIKISTQGINDDATIFAMGYSD